MASPLDASERSVPTLGRDRLVLVDGRTFAISDDAGQMTAATHGMVHDDLRHLSTFVIDVDDAHVDILASSTSTPLSGVIVGRLRRGGESTGAILTRRRWISGGLREDIHIHNTGSHEQRWTVTATIRADFLHVFDVKAGLAGTEAGLEPDGTGVGWRISPPDQPELVTRIGCTRAPVTTDDPTSTLTWELTAAPRSDVVLTIVAEPVVDNVPGGLAFPIGTAPGEAVPMRRLAAWQQNLPRIVSTDHRLAPVVEQSFADLAALRIVDTDHSDRAVVAAGAPWFMTLFGRDSLLTAWMALPFEPSLAAGVLGTLGDLQGTVDDPVSEEQPGRILHELRRRGGGGPFASRQRYYGTVDATPLYVMLAAEARRWGALSDRQLAALAPNVDAAIGWIIAATGNDSRGFLGYSRISPAGLSNQGWKDSWDGITFADGSLPTGPIALVEVQGYAFAALRGAAELSTHCRLARSTDELLSRASALQERFNASFWDESHGWYALGIDGAGRRIDALTTNPGHALWTGIADPDLADAYLDRLIEPAMWTGWGLRTLAADMGAYDPLSYHNGSVWPHDTAICAAGAARYGRFDVVDLLYAGALDAAVEFGDRPPELFAGIDRTEAPMPVAYPTSCSPQAWSSASVLMLLRALLDLSPSIDTTEVLVGRTRREQVPDIELTGLRLAGRSVSLSLGTSPHDPRSG